MLLPPSMRRPASLRCRTGGEGVPQGFGGRGDLGWRQLGASQHITSARRLGACDGWCPPEADPFERPRRTRRTRTNPPEAASSLVTALVSLAGELYAESRRIPAQIGLVPAAGKMSSCSLSGHRGPGPEYCGGFAGFCVACCLCLDGALTCGDGCSADCAGSACGVVVPSPGACGLASGHRATNHRWRQPEAAD